MRRLPLLALLLLLPGCSTTTTVRQGRRTPINEGRFSLVMPPFLNATDNEHAGQALTQLAGSALLEQGMPLIQTEEILNRAADDSVPKRDVRYQDIGRANKVTYLLMGTVHEYRYKSDLNASPAVGITLRLVNATDGRTLWQGSCSKVGRTYGSLTSTAHKTVRELVSKVPLKVLP